MSNKFAEIIITISHRDLDRVFHYKIPPEYGENMEIGTRVIVPFGRSNKRYDGYVVGFADSVDIDEAKIKPIISVWDGRPFFNAELLSLARWMQTKYYTTLIDCLKCIMPSGMGFSEDKVLRIADGDLPPKLSKTKDQVITFLRENGGIMLQSELENELSGNIKTAIKGLVSDNILVSQDISKIKDLTLKMKFAFINHENEDLDELIEFICQKESPQKSVIELLLDSQGMAVSDVKKYLGISSSPLETLVKKDVIKIESVEVYRHTADYTKDDTVVIPTPTLNQEKALDFFENKTDKKPVLIHGVTGSGKTEIYLRLIEKAIDLGKEAIVLVPEISLTPQTVGIFVNRFGNKVSVTHSHLTMGERYDQWKKAKDGEISIMIGPRSAIFTPFNNLGIIIIDEEHEKTYKSETSPKYSSKEVAIKRAELTGAQVVLGSATPSVETYYQCSTQEFDLITINQRVNNNPPEICVVDMRVELAEGNTSIFSDKLHKAMIEALERGEQVILFLNRRGFSTFVSCRSCGYVMACDSCNINYTYHTYNDKLICHYCGKKIKNPTNCPQCGSKYIKYFGVGTQKIEEEVSRIFPDTTILRMDMDTTSGKNSHNIILSQFRRGEAQILIGTQMIAKGLDFPNVSLVGIIAADLSLNNGDFRAGETTYQLLTQVSGRAGRAAIDGKVFIQTYSPQHYSIIYAKNNDYHEFYSHEIALRKQMVYPPYSHIFSILFSGENEKDVIESLFKLLDIMKYYNRKNLFEILGPAPAIISKVKKKYRWKIIVKSVEEEKLKNFVLYTMDKLRTSPDFKDSHISVNLTMDPVLLV